MEDQPVHPLPPKIRLGAFDVTYPRVAIALTTIALAFIFYLINQIICLMVVLIGAGLLSWNKKGPGYSRLLTFFTSYNERRKGGAIYTSGLTDHSLFGEDNPRPKKMKPFAVKLEILRMAAGDGYLGLLHHETLDEDTVYIQLDGWTAAANADSDQLAIMNQTLASTVAEVLQDRKLGVTALSYFFVRRPHDMTQPATYLGQDVHLTYKLPEDEVARRLIANVYEACGLIASQSSQIFMGIAVTAPRARSWRKRGFDPANVTEEQLRKAPIIDATLRLASRLQSFGVENPRIMSPLELVTFFKAVLDVSPEVQHFYKELLRDRELDAAGELTDYKDALTLQRGPWPSEIKLGYKEVTTDQTITRAYFVDGFRSQEEFPDYFQELLAIPGCWFSVAFVGWPVSGQSAKRRNKQQRLWHASTLNPDDRLTTSESVARAQAAEQEEFDLFRSRGLALDGGIYLTVSATSFGELEMAEMLVLETCNGMGIRASPIMREARQLLGLFVSYGGVGLQSEAS